MNGNPHESSFLFLRPGWGVHVPHNGNAADDRNVGGGDCVTEGEGAECDVGVERADPWPQVPDIPAQKIEEPFSSL